MTSAPFVVAAVVMAQVGLCFLGMYRGRPDAAVLREGAACIVFAAHAAAHAVGLALGRGHAEVGAWLEWLTTLALVPAWVGLGVNVDPELSRRVRAAGLYAGVGAVLGLLVFVPAVASGPVFTLAGQRVAALEVGAALVLAVGLGMASSTTALMARAVRAGRSVKVGSGTLVATMALATAFALVDALSRLGGRRFALVDFGILCVALALFHATVGRLRSLGDELQRKTSALTRSYAEFHATQARLVRNEQLAAVGELSAVIAHEVRNPLAIIKNALAGLRRKSITVESRTTLLDIMDEETDRLNRLMHDLLAYARPVAPRLLPVDLTRLFERSIERAFGGVVRPRGLEVRYDVDAPDGLEADFELLVHALVNVVENGLQAMPSGGTLTLAARAAELDDRPAVALLVTDTGEGMDNQVREKARDPFFTTRPTGTGLGLAIVERVVRNHGGRIDFQSEPGSGTTVRLLLPLDRQSLMPLPPPEGSTRFRVSGAPVAP